MKEQKLRQLIKEQIMLNEKLNEASTMEDAIYANLTRISQELEGVRRQLGEEKAIEVIDRIMLYLKDKKADLEYKISQK